MNIIVGIPINKTKPKTWMISELLKEKKEFIEKFLKSIEGKEGKTTFNLNGVEIDLGKTKAKVDGKLEISFSPKTKETKK